ncbi:SGNH/GDSL hydrolase family protein [Bradyrhizobium sp. Leo121]|uniref:SGNH/GDSL hydrolase family protein n=1 Tax=Bradyrhizobium sp. Leo121 TaxID=1571195 RepID=UPI001FDEFB27|nr:SGNH/GDSL hydrolase family protein [Bradyrhizobium sp. Leo121]
MPAKSSRNRPSTLNSIQFVRPEMIDNFADAELPDQLIAFKYPLTRLAEALRHGGPLKIVAMGSSSTAGREDVLPYPYWLEMYLRRACDNPRIDVLNRGVGGQEAIEELDRFDSDIFAEAPAPSLVIWQVGTNAVFHKEKYNVDDVAEKIAVGVDRLRAHAGQMDVLLIDPQHVPAMLIDDKAELSERMVWLIAAVAERAGVNVFRRWALMQHWHAQNNIGFDRMVDPTDPDRLHQSDGSTLRMSRGLNDAIRKAAAVA